MLDSVLKLLRVLNGDVSPNQIAAGISFGFILGLTPFWSLHNLIVILLICLLRVNVASAIVSLAGFSVIAYLFDPLMERLGYAILTGDSLSSLWTGWYQIDLLRLAHFNNTLVMGSVVLAIVLWPVVFLVSRFIVINYRERILAWVQKTRFMQALKASRWYQRIYGVMSVEV
ncbi:Uncharacterised protein [BD1-7 clade bacterium]|uniref:DUF2062 domain-containing protein n=1 Tax=BD1-7 clade bacterium TaxID=2029982 RepID=A0A5S9N2D5_9GAMM|nr:Uncharacterised protein [BD1-7 clade bacterium]CAA0084026.1 Uncharacterised protein [BD1-7 clade bacterium]